ncbi:hypothetical protein [Tenacibaculum discolor]|uniref:hypothetical protein n=1 Tax=Tenacibaculum discolor TaxID=361581 RepID=UPI000F5AB740|nr:hypothetical protein [Tenacibaculum discolor]
MRRIKAHLMTPIFYLYKIEEVGQIQMNKKMAKKFKDIYDKNTRVEIFESLQWAEENKDFSFESIMEDAPVRGKLKFTNEEVYDYLMNFKKFMENEEYGLLTDDRPTNRPWEK